MHFNVLPHIAWITEYLQEVNIPVSGWPANSPDLNTIEYISVEEKDPDVICPDLLSITVSSYRMEEEKAERETLAKSPRNE